jgi:hypothetical protein
MMDERVAPMAKGGFANVQANAVETHRRHEEMHMRVRLVGVQRQGVSMCVRHLLPDKATHRVEELLG